MKRDRRKHLLTLRRRLLALVGIAAVGIVAQTPTFRSTVREVSVVFRVVDKQNHLVPGVTRDEIRVQDEGIERKITSFSGDVSYSQIVVAADVSGSMIEVLEPLRAALFDFADLVGSESNDTSGDVLLTLLPFSESARVLVDRTPDPKAFKDAVSRIRPSGSTALIDAILSTVLNAFGDVSVQPVAVKTKTDDGGPIASEFRRRGPSSGMPVSKRAKFLVVFTDAGENSSGHQWADIASAVLGKEVVIYSVIFDSGTPDANVPKLAGITRDSGGEVYRAKAGDLKRVYAQIARNIRGHYSLTFDATDVTNALTWRNLHVTTTRPGLTVLANTGYCPETPCQKADGTFVGGSPKNWRQVMSMNQDPAVVAAVKQQLRNQSFGYTRATSAVVSALSERPLLVERRWNPHEKGSKPYFVTHPANQSVSVDAEACGITLAPEHSAAAPQPSGDIAGQQVLEVVDPEIRLLRRPVSGASTKLVSNDQDDYFQSQVVFYLVDPSGGIRPSLKIQCNRPHFLVGNGLAEFATEAVSEALKLTPEASRTHPVSPQPSH
ncbi:MAG: VWA domain-containing protein [Bryobacteraceae bacterium]